MRPHHMIRAVLIVQGALLGLLAVAGLVVALVSGGVGNVLMAAPWAAGDRELGAE